MLERAANGEFLEEIGGSVMPGSVLADTGDRHWIIRAAVLRHLLTGTGWAVDPKGVRLRGLRIQIERAFRSPRNNRVALRFWFCCFCFAPINSKNFRHVVTQEI